VRAAPRVECGWSVSPDRLDEHHEYQDCENRRDDSQDAAEPSCGLHNWSDGSGDTGADDQKLRSLEQSLVCIRLHGFESICRHRLDETIDHEANVCES